MCSTPKKGERSAPSNNRLFIPGKSMPSLLRKKVVTSPEKTIEERLNDFDLDANEILSWLHGTAGTEALFPKQKTNGDVLDS